MKKKSTERRSIASTVARQLAKYSGIPRKVSLTAHTQRFDDRFGMTSEELEKLLAEAREVGDEKYERLQRLRKYSTTPKEYIVPAVIEKSAKRVGKL